MTKRPYTSLDYKMLTKWWVDNDWTPVAEDCLPKTGLIVDECAAGFLYATDSNIAWLEWVVADKFAEKLKRSRAIDALIYELCEAARIQGFKLIFTSVKHDRLEKRYLNQGFNKGDTGVTQMIRLAGGASCQH